MRPLLLAALVSLAASHVTGCRTDTPQASAPSAGSATATTSSPPPAASAPITAGLQLALTGTETRGTAGDGIKLDFTLANRTAAPIKLAYYRPLGFRLDLSDPISGRPVTLSIPAFDTPVERVALTLAPGESKALPTAVTLWFDDTGKSRGSMFDWIVVAKKCPLALSASFDVELGDAGSVTLHATARTP